MFFVQIPTLMYHGYKDFTYVYLWPVRSQRLVVGDASETALLKFTELTIGNIMVYRDRFNKVVEVPFNSTNKFQVSNIFTTMALLMIEKEPQDLRTKPSCIKLIESLLSSPLPFLRFTSFQSSLFYMHCYDVCNSLSPLSLRHSCLCMSWRIPWTCATSWWWRERQSES